MIRRTLMKRNRELAEFEIDPATGKVRVLDVSEAGSGLLDSKELTVIVKARTISRRRADMQDVLASFGALSPIHLAFMGHGLSLSDQYWYRAPGSTERWEDINFFDNEWDPSFGTAVFKRDYASLASCSPDVPDVTTQGKIVKTWERDDDGGILLIKESRLPHGDDLKGVKLASELCALLFDEGCYVPARIVERFGRPCSASPLMLAPDEELANGNRLFTMAGMRGLGGWGMDGAKAGELYQARIRAYTAVGIPDASAHVAKRACLSCLALLLNDHPENFGVIRKVGSDTWRAAPIFDYDGSFGFLDDERAIARLCENPQIAAILCFNRYSFLDSSWDWTWYDPKALDGFEDRIVEVLSSCHNMPSNYAMLSAGFFDVQRAYVNEIASGQA